jgi:DNA-binding GntR family transcriptional regulator
MPVPAPRPGEASGRTLLRDAAYVRLRDAILDGTLAPGEQLRDADLVAWLGLSRTPIREALARLEQQGLVESAPNRWTRVAPIDRDDVRDAFEVVAALHGLAAELALSDIGQHELRVMRAANRDFATALRHGDVDEAIEADDAFHYVFLGTADNAELERTLERLMPRVRRLERARFASLSGRTSVKQHDRIVDCAARGSVRETVDAVRSNWRSLGALIESSFPPDEDE